MNSEFDGKDRGTSEQKRKKPFTYDANLPERVILAGQHARSEVQKTVKPHELRFVPDIYDAWEPWDKLQKISSALLDNSLTIDSGLEAIQTIPAIQRRYPTLEVPQTFSKERPNIKFAPLSLSGYKPWTYAIEDYRSGEISNPYGGLFNRLHESSIKDLPITNPEELRQAWSLILPMRDAQDIKSTHVEEVLSQVTLSYFENLELHRLTKDKDGTIMRWTNKEQDEINAQNLNEYGPWSSNVPDSTRILGRWKHTTFWFRQDARNNYFHSRGRTLAVKTVADLETDHYLALDTAEDRALVAIQK